MKILRYVALLTLFAICFTSPGHKAEAQFCSYRPVVMMTIYYLDSSYSKAVGGCDRDCPGDGTMTWTCWGEQTIWKKSWSGSCWICTQ